MIIENKTLIYDKPKTFKLFEKCALRDKIKTDIENEFNSYYSNERTSKYDGGKVARTSFLSLDFTCLRFKDSQVVFEIFEMNNIEEGNMICNYTKGKVLEKMILDIKFKEM